MLFDSHSRTSCQDDGIQILASAGRKSRAVDGTRLFLAIRIIRLDPKIAAAYYVRGLAWYMKGDYDKGIADYDETLRLDPKHAQAPTYREEARKAKTRSVLQQPLKKLWNWTSARKTK